MKKIIIILAVFYVSKVQAQTLYIKSGTTVTVKKDASITAPNIYVSGNLQNDGTLSDEGKIEVSGNFTNVGTLEHKIRGPIPNTDYDKIAVGGDVTLTGSNLTESFGNSYTPTGSETFTIFAANNIVGIFSVISLPALSSGLSWVSAYNSPTGTMKLSVAAVLPIELLNFSATTQKSSVSLRWNTALEKNADGFNLERSQNGIDFKAIHFEKARGSNSFYDYTDENPKQGINYYRLISKDLDGSTESSKILTATFNGDEKTLKIYPTIVSDRLIIEAQREDIGQVALLNEVGQILWTATSDVTFMTIDTQNLAAGIYFVSVLHEGKNFVQKVIKP